jgi:hypothetical protein
VSACCPPIRAVWSALEPEGVIGEAVRLRARSGNAGSARSLVSAIGGNRERYGAPCRGGRLREGLKQAGAYRRLGVQ